MGSSTANQLDMLIHLDLKAVFCFQCQIFTLHIDFFVQFEFPDCRVRALLIHGGVVVAAHALQIVLLVSLALFMPNIPLLRPTCKAAAQRNRVPCSKILVKGQRPCYIIMFCKKTLIENHNSG